MISQTVRMSSGGRLVVPVEIRRALGLDEGVAVVMRVEDTTIQIQTVPESIARAQKLVAQYVPDNISLVDELIADRRGEAARERD
jgi:antitoxin PrlF